MLDNKRMAWKEAESLKGTFPNTAEKAVTQGQMYFNTGVPCNNGHYSPRSLANEKRCVLCLLAKNKKQRSGSNYWVEVTKAAERKARNRAKELGCLPEGYKKEECEPLYILAALCTQNLGEPYAVDHRIPLSLGGQHHPDNLLVVRSTVNRAKGNMTEVSYHQKLLVGAYLDAISYGHSIRETL